MVTLILIKWILCHVHKGGVCRARWLPCWSAALTYVSTQAAFQPALHFSTWSLLLIMLNNNDGRERENQRYSALPLIIDFFVSGIFFGIFFQVYFCWEPCMWCGNNRQDSESIREASLELRVTRVHYGCSNLLIWVPKWEAKGSVTHTCYSRLLCGWLLKLLKYVEIFFASDNQVSKFITIIAKICSTAHL